MTRDVLLATATTRIAAEAKLPMDSDVFAGFYERSARPLWAYLARASGDPALADDLTQESFVRYLCADAKVQGEVEARRYLFRIGTNLLKDHWRRPRVNSLEEVPETEFASGECSSQMNSQALLGPAMAQMKPRERQLLWLAHAEGYSHKEVAEIMGIGSTSVRLMLFRARRKMATLLRDGGAA